MLSSYAPTDAPDGTDRRSLSLDQPGLALLLKGDADIHVVLTGPDGRPGRRRHLLHLSGGAVFGFGPADTEGTVRLELVSSEECRLLAFQAEDDIAHANLVDGWITAVAGAMDSLISRLPWALTTDTAAVTAASLRWVQAGSEQFLPERAIALEASAEAGPQAAIVADPLDPAASATITLDLIRRGELDAALARFHRLVRQALTARLAEHDVSESRRLALRARREQIKLHEAFWRFRRVLGERRRLQAIDGASASERLFAACAEVADRIGVTLERPRDPGAGTPREMIAAIADASRLRFRRVRLTGDWWRHDGGDLIGFIDNAPVALLVHGGRRYVSVDPAQGAPVAVTAESAARVGRFGFSLYRPLPDRPLNALDVLRAGLRNQQRALVVIVAAGASGGLLALLTPMITGAIFDDVIPSAGTAQLADYVGIMLAAAIGSAIFGLSQGLSLLRLRGQSVTVLQAAVWDRLLSLPTSFFRGFTAGDLSNRALGINAISSALTGVSLGTTFSAVFSLFSLGLMLFYSWRLSIYGILMTLPPIAVGIVAATLQTRQQRPILDLQGRMTGMMFQFIAGIAKLRVAAAERRAFLVWSREYARQVMLHYVTRRRGWRLGLFTSLYNPLTTLGLFIIVAWLAHGLKSGDFVAFNMAFQQFLGAVMGLVGAAGSSIGVVPTYRRAEPILRATPEFSVGRLHPGMLRGAIDVQEVTFRYDSVLVLEQVTFSVTAGTFVAICGPSGSGKSTLLRLLLGFERPTAGLIAYDRKDISNLDLRALRQQIGVVLQGSRLMPGTMYQNIVGNGAFTLQQAWHAAEQAGLVDDILAMPMRMQTFVSEGAATLSGGQRQRLLLARALVREPRILLLDEATSALDNKTQAVVTRSLEALSATRIVIAHRLSTIERADRILVMQRGRIGEDGTYDDLVGRDGAFARLVQRQTL